MAVACEAGGDLKTRNHKQRARWAQLGSALSRSALNVFTRPHINNWLRLNADCVCTRAACGSHAQLNPKLEADSQSDSVLHFSPSIAA